MPDAPSPHFGNYPPPGVAPAIATSGNSASIGSNPNNAMVANANPETAASPASGSAFPWGSPTSQSLDNDATKSLVEALPEDTLQLIVREAYLFRAGEIILQAREEAKARHEQVSSTRPPFFALRRAETKDAFNANLEAVAQDLSLYDKAAKRNADAMKRLRKCAELHIEDWLRENDATYHAGLVSETLVADWHRCLVRLDTGLSEFITAIGSARNALVSSSADAKGVRYVSDISRKAIMQAAEMGALLAAEVAATNALADERDRNLAGTAFESAFPRLPAFDFAASLREAAAMPVSFLQQEFTKIMERCDELRSVGLPALLQQVQQAETQHAAVKDSYLVGVWQSLRVYAIAHYVDENDLNHVARETEDMFEQGTF